MPLDTPPPKKVDGEEPDDMVRVDEDTGEVFTDPEPTEPTDVPPEVVEEHREEIEQAKQNRASQNDLDALKE